VKVVHRRSERRLSGSSLEALKRAWGACSDAILWRAK
jgi:hypothetical protein